MLRKLLRDAERYRKRKQQRSIWRKFVQIVACFVVFCTTYALILPAITMEKQKCTLEEHTHTESCYKQAAAEPVVSLVCTYEALGIHVHTSECFDSENKLLCGLADYVLHEHNDACLDKDGNLVCRLPVVMEHKHTDDCYRIQKTSNTPETEGPHVHNADCYSTERGELICKTAETEGHAHGDACYGRGQLVCPLQEQEGHTHGNGCTETVLACELTTEPHSHGDDCYQQLECELTEDETHTHSEECSGKVLNCDLTEQPHIHKDSCYQTNSLCDLPETEGHTHSDACYESVLECKLTEEDSHSHTDSCYDRILKLSCGLEEGSPSETKAQETTDSETAEPELVCEKEVIQLHSHQKETCYEISEDGNLQLICTKPEVLEHIHAESCFVTEEPTEEDTHKLTCTLSEGHVHAEGCYDETDTLVCEETENHTHGSLCYGTWELICGKEEHAHTDECRLKEPVKITLSKPAAATSETEPVVDPTVESTGDSLPDGKKIGTSDVYWEIIHDPDGDVILRFSGNGAIPDFAENETLDSQLWRHELNDTHVHVEFGPEITTVGERALEWVNITSIDWGGVTAINDFAFSNGQGPAVINIPGQIASIGSYAFGWRTEVDHFVLNEGTTSLHQGCLYAGNGTATLCIPASVTSIHASPMAGVAAYEIADGNANYRAADGVLFTTDSTLIAYPSGQQTALYQIPEGTAAIHEHAFSGAQRIDTLEIPASVHTLNSLSFEGANIRELFFKDNSTLANVYGAPLKSVTTLANIRFPEGTAIALPNLLESSTTYDRYTHFTIPDGITSIGNLDGKLPGLESITYNAANAQITTAKLFDSRPAYDLIIGAAVNELPTGFSVFVSNAGAVHFQKNADGSTYCKNTFFANSGALAGAGQPLESLSGKLHVEPNGVIYQLMDDNTAKVVYAAVDAGESITIPATIKTDTDDGSKSYTVTAVGTNAFRCAKNLTSLIFAAPEQITDLAPMAMANCPSLTSVNGLYTKTAVEEIFPNATMPADIFYNTAMEGLGGGTYETNNLDGTGKNALVVNREGATSMEITITDPSPNMVWEQAGDGTTGLYKLETGDRINYYVSVGSTTEDQFVYRVYLRTTGEDAMPSLKPNESLSFNDKFVTCYATDDPNVTYLEYVQTSGSAIQFSYSMVYPSPSSPGGGAEVWGVILTKEEAAENRLTVFPSESGVIQAQWDTERYDFTLAKKGNNQNVNIVSNGQGGCKPGSNLGWTITLSGPGDSGDKLGEDHLKSAAFTDSITLPQGFYWNTKVEEALRSGAVQLVAVDGNTYDFMANGLRVARITRDSSSAEIRNVEAYWHEYEVEGEKKTNLAFRWELYNNTETDMNTSTLTLTVYSDAVLINLNDLADNNPHTIKNDVASQLNYHYSDPVTKEATANDTVDSTAGVLTLQKSSTQATYLGEAITYTLKLSNQGVIPFMGKEGEEILLVDELDFKSYMTPEQMEAMFDLYPEGFEIQIWSALLTAGGWKPVTGVDGTESWIHCGNSNIDTTKHKLFISPYTFPDGTSGYQVRVENGGTFTATTVAEALQLSGYALTRNDDYFCVWTLQKPDSESLYLHDVGVEREYTVYATAKNTFSFLSADRKNEYPTQYDISLNNIAKFLRNNKILWSASAAQILDRDAYIKKSLYRGDEPADIEAPSHDEVLTYHLDFHHYGTGSYQNLPMTDFLGGSQFLLVPKEPNSGLANKGLEVHEHDGIEYYVLNKDGTYTDVVVGEYYMETAAGVTERRPMIANSIEFVMKTSGLVLPSADIKWYFPELPGEEYQIHVQYNVLTDLYAMGGMWLLGNTVNMNDRDGTQIYDSISGMGETMHAEKKIVTQMRDVNVSEILAEHSTVSEDDRVIYKLTLENPSNGAMQVNGDTLADVLPPTFDLFEWNKQNVELIKIEAEGGASEYSMLYDWHFSDSFNIITSDYGYQFICWPEDSYITIGGQSSIHMYFALTYPKNGEDGIWDKYTAIVGGNTIANTFTVDMFLGSSVTHDLMSTGKVLLQKGVSGMYYYTNNVEYRPAGASRRYYNNQDKFNRAVVYYVTLYNGGNTRLYLEDLHDQLPEGFTFLQLLNGSPETIKASSNVNAITTTGKTLTNYPGIDVSYRNVKITPTKTDNGVKFRIEDTDKDDHYDKERMKYFLLPGEAISFAYACDTGTKSIETPENTTATNTIAMPYNDHLDAGLTLIPDTVLPVYAADSDVFTDSNNGSRILNTREEVAELYGFESTSGSEEMWLVSQVDVKQGEIIPGVTKFIDTYQVPESNTLNDYTHSVPYDATVNWRVRLHNSGTKSLVNYTFSDTMPKPYVFEGNIKFTYYDMHHTELGTQTIATIPSRTEDGTTLSIVPATGDPISLEIDGQAVSVGTDISLSIRKDDKGNEVLTIVCGAKDMAIPEGGYVDVTLSSRNPTKNHRSGFYTNYATLDPEQPFARADHGHVVMDESGKPEHVIGNSSVNIVFGYATSSEKRITEDGRPTNTAVSIDPLGNTIMLERADSTFTYQLRVVNSTDHSMTKLVIIDNLPQPEDHIPFDTEAYRDSAFTVHFADDLNFVVSITDKNGVVNTLNPEDDLYTLEFSESTDFGGEQSDDWKGEDTGKWSAEQTDKSRSLRLIIKDENGTLIPDGARVDVTFKAKAGADAKPGDYAWNNFGYHFGVLGTKDEMEAMPLSVGVTVPSVPSLQKQLVAFNGKNESIAEEPLEFKFLVYEGAPLSGTYASEQALRAALNAANRANDEIQEFTVSVDAGQAESAVLLLNDVPWHWTQGHQYTITEIDTAVKYDFFRFNNYPDAHYTFTYDVNNIQKIVCKNRLEEWTLRLFKTNMDGNPLSNAVFALYRPAKPDEFIDGVDDQWGIKKTITVSGRNWCLQSIKQTKADGLLTWEELLEKDYYLVEIKAPDGYNLPKSGQIIHQSSCDENAVCNVQVENELGYTLPETGGIGTASYTLGGLLMITAAILLYIHILKRRKED